MYYKKTLNFFAVISVIQSVALLLKSGIDFSFLRFNTPFSIYAMKAVCRFANDLVVGSRISYSRQSRGYVPDLWKVEVGDTHCFIVRNWPQQDCIPVQFLGFLHHMEESRHGPGHEVILSGDPCSRFLQVPIRNTSEVCIHVCIYF